MFSAEGIHYCNIWTKNCDLYVAHVYSSAQQVAEICGSDPAKHMFNSKHVSNPIHFICTTYTLQDKQIFACLVGCGS